MTIDPTKSFEVPDGIDLGTGFRFMSGTFDPSSVGLDTGLFSRYYRDNGETWVKNGVADTDWLLLVSSASVSASPPFEFYRGELVSDGEYLFAGGQVPSNNRGRPVPVSNGQVISAFFSSTSVATVSFDIEIRTDPGGVPTFTHLKTFSVTGSRKVIIPLTGANVGQGDELVMRLSSGSAVDPLVGIVIYGQA